MDFAHYLHIALVIGYRCFQRTFLWGGGSGEGGYVGGSFHGRNFQGGRKSSWKGTPNFPALF